ncbi:DUF3558 family protein [Plantactinospora sp. S1510]|uniref:DUF3558 family protein n=1 Tax=Plantactinospora alkalitolerans TaxID=2789879 RepID=A0ABS0H820_9ACTN|nr:DUF3558 family protein [Plantactinospora alkalitolerans]MBF9134621.1 DUF3558 family protein [Plantactinospora alkalitolerans]
MSLAVAGCGSGDPDEPDTAGTTPAPTVTTSAETAPPSTVAASPAATLVELARQPCRALDQQDSGKLGIIIEGSETDLDGRSCQWGTATGLVAFTPYPSVDQTAAQEFRHLKQTTIDGRRAVAGTTTRGGCTTLVAIGARQSFRLIASPLGEDTAGSKSCPLNTTFATAILAHLD